jgi:hypothetical protein
MSWRVCRVLDFQKNCTSIHGTEEMAKLDTGGHLAALITRLEENLPKYAGVWNYARVFPGFVEDLAQMINTVGPLLQEEQIWGAYDEWHRFMNRWEGILHVPIWAQVGTVIVEGPGPTVESIFQPMRVTEKLAKKKLYHPEMHKIMDAEWDLRRELQLLWTSLSLDIFAARSEFGLPVIPIEEIRKNMEQIASQIDIGPIKSDELMEHWMKLVRQEAFQHYGIST